MTEATSRKDTGLRAIAWDDKPEDFMTDFSKVLLKNHGISLEVESDVGEFNRRFKDEGHWDFVVLDLYETKEDGEVDPYTGMRLEQRCRQAQPQMPIFVVTASTSAVVRQTGSVVPPTYYLAKELGPAWVAMDIEQILIGLQRVRSDTFTGSTTLILAALAEELAYLFEEPGWDWSALRNDRFNFPYRTCVIDGRRIIAAHAPRMGLTHAAATASILFHEWRPGLAFLIGVCAGRKQMGVSLGDVIIPELAYHFQYGRYVDGEIQGQLAVENVDSGLLAVAKDYFSRDENTDRIRAEFGRRGNRPDNVLCGHYGPMACSDLVVMDKDKFEEAAKADRKVIALEMESYAFLLAARLSGVGKALVVKSATDFADAKKNNDFREYAKFTSTKAMLAILDRLR